MFEAVLQRHDWPMVATTYGRENRVRKGSGDGLTSVPYALDFAFRPQKRAVFDREGKVEEVQIQGLTGGAVGSEEIHFLETAAASEFVEVRPSTVLRNEVITDLDAAPFAEHERTWNDNDPALFVLALRIRADALGGRPLDALEIEQLTRNALARSFEKQGALMRPKARYGLDARRLSRIVDFVDAHIADDLSLTVMADVAAVGRFHFARMFRLSTGMTPHGYVAARRMERAAGALRSNSSVFEAAKSVGYALSHRFRTTFQCQFGVSPSEYLRLASSCEH